VLSHVWFGGWSFLKLPSSWYLAFGVLYFVALVGLAKFLWLSNRVTATVESFSRPGILVLLCFYGFFCLGLAYDALLTFVSMGVSSTTGWYMYCLTIAEVVLLICGLQTLFPVRMRRWLLSSVTWAFILLDAYGLIFLLLPYYTGIISHDKVGNVQAASLRTLMHAGLRNLGERVIVNNSDTLAAPLLSALALLYFGSSLWIALQSWTHAQARNICFWRDHANGRPDHPPRLGRSDTRLS
jgi:hypothetical protein